MLIGLGVPDNAARMEQRLGRIPRPGSPFPQVQHIIVVTDTDFDRRSLRRIERKEAEAARIA